MTLARAASSQKIDRLLHALAMWLTLLPLAFVTRPAQAQAHRAPPVQTQNAAAEESQRDAICSGCHLDLVGQYRHTAHATASQPANVSTVLGRLLPPNNRLVIREARPGPGLTYFIDRGAHGLQQRSVRGVEGAWEEHHASMDVVIGSGVRGQSFLGWQDDRLFELPVSWWREGNRWINSPGYPDGSVQWDRPATSRCLECHMDVARPLSDAVRNNRFERGSLQSGIGCARCHGDGADHVAAARAGSHSGRQQQPFPEVLNPGQLSRERQVQLCALCHGGQREQLAPAFTYRTGDDLDGYLQPPVAFNDVPDVHGNQVGLLQRSRCYIGSPQMTCSTCHRVHEPERSAESYADRCLLCHRVQQCGEYATRGVAIERQCIGCHMPLQPTRTIVSVTAGETIATSLRTHWIRIYPPAAAVGQQGREVDGQEQTHRPTSAYKQADVP